MKSKVITIVLGILSAALLGGASYYYVTKDGDGPQIAFTDSTLVYQKGDDIDVLLQDAVAYDAVDGDVSDTLRIEDITITNDHKNISVAYVAKDTKNNIAKSSRIIAYKSGSKNIANDQSKLVTMIDDIRFTAYRMDKDKKKESEEILDEKNDIIEE